MESLEIDCMGEAFTLYPERAALWQSKRTLLIADLHLGKSQMFRDAGIALPRGHTQADLNRLATLLKRSGADRLIVLGDVVHGSVRMAPWMDDWQNFLRAHTQVHCCAIIGNHDRQLANAELGLDLLGESSIEGPFCFEHERRTHSHHFSFSGHVHPVVKLPGLRRMPAFCFEATHAILPAFSEFTGGFQIQQAANRSLYVCAQNELFAI
jgi:uncharacterized protein